MSNKLVTYFSAGGVTRGVAERLAASIGADVFEIVPQHPYTKADINWRNPLSRCNKEWFGKQDVPVSGHVEHMEQYDTIYVGFPIWYGVAPNVVHTFLKGYDLTGKRLVVFATSGGSGIGKTAEKMQPIVDPAVIVKAELLQPSIGDAELAAWAEV